MGFKCQNLCKVYHSAGRPITALLDISFNVDEQEFVCIVGPSGCGKTTLLKLLAGLLTPSSGSISFDGSEADHRPRTALVFQNHGLFPWMKVLDNVAFGLEMMGVKRKERHHRARQFIDRVGLASFADRYPHELSVGMQQRAGIARAFLSNPRILLMDEPFSALDAQTRRVLQEELLNTWRAERQMVLYVTHDIEEAVLMGDRVLVMTGSPGRIREEIPITLERPRNLSVGGRNDIMKTKDRIWQILEKEVRKSLGLSG
jgi:NitT/TauT family transport system ATP-binding protein